MEGSVNIFFALLRSGLYGNPIPESEMLERIDWKAVMALAKKHAVEGIIIDSVQRLPESLRPSDALYAKMSKFALGLIRTNLILDSTLARLVSFLGEHGVNGVLLKGQGVARYYRAPQMRHCGDIDFYVGKKQFRKAAELCRAELCDDESECSENEQHFDFFMDGVCIELHRLASRIYTPVKSGRFQKWVVGELEQSEPRRILSVDNTDVRLPSYDFDAIYIFYHAWRHYLQGGIGLRQLCDWAMIFHSHAADIDKEKLMYNIRRFGLTKGWKLFACIAVSHLGVPENLIPLYDPSYSVRAEIMLRDIMEDGNFGVYSEANRRTPIFGCGVKHALGKVRNITGYYVEFFPLIPVEATFLFFNRAIFGARDYTKRAIHKYRRKS